ncbi:MAG: hypothetical protein AAFU70_08960, partial [Planctomycetota bacterium]
MADIKALAEQLVGLTLLEANELKNLLKDEYGIEPAAGGAVMMAGPAGGGEAEGQGEREGETSRQGSAERGLGHRARPWVRGARGGSRFPLDARCV